MRDHQDSSAEGELQADLKWPEDIYAALKAARVLQVTYVPDAGHSKLIRLLCADPEVTCNVLTTEEEGIAVSAGAWLGGRRSVVLMQSSGVGNCINMLSLPVIARIPLLMLVTMRGEWEEFNPWQAPMGLAVEKTFGAMGITTVRVETSDDAGPAVAAAAQRAFTEDCQIAVILAQRMLGKKKW